MHSLKEWRKRTFSNECQGGKPRLNCKYTSKSTTVKSWVLCEKGENVNED